MLVWLVFFKEFNIEAKKNVVYYKSFILIYAISYFIFNKTFYNINIVFQKCDFVPILTIT